MKYQCINPDCPDYGKEEYLSSESFSYVNGKLQGKHCECPKCGQLREEIDPNKDIPLSEKNIGFAFYNGMSKEQKQKVLKDRAHQHFKKEVKDRKEHLLGRAVNEMRNLHKD